MVPLASSRARRHSRPVTAQAASTHRVPTLYRKTAISAAREQERRYVDAARDRRVEVEPGAFDPLDPTEEGIEGARSARRWLNSSRPHAMNRRIAIVVWNPKMTFASAPLRRPISSRNESTMAGASVTASRSISASSPLR